MNDPLTFAEKQRLHDKFLLARRNAPGPLNPNADRLAGEDFRDALKRWAAGEEIEIPPPVPPTKVGRNAQFIPAE